MTSDTPAPNNTTTPALTFGQILKSADLNDTQIQSTTGDLADILEKQVLKAVGTALSEKQLHILNTLKTEQSIDRFLRSQLPDLNQIVTGQINSLKQEVQTKVQNLATESTGRADHLPEPSTPASPLSLESDVASPAGELQPSAMNGSLPAPAMSLEPSAMNVPSPLPPMSPEPSTMNSPLPPAIQEPPQDDKLLDFKKKWQSLMEPPPEGSKTKKKQNGNKDGKKSKFPPLPPLPPLPGGKKEPTEEEKQEKEAKRQKEREEALAKQALQHEQDAAAITELVAKIELMAIGDGVQNESTTAATATKSDASIKRQLSALEKQLHKATHHNNWEAAREITQMIRAVKQGS